MQILVRRLESEDLKTRAKWFNTPSISEQMVIDTPLSIADTRKWFANNVLSRDRCDFSFLSQAESLNQALVAMGGLTGVDWRHQRAELYVVVNPSMTGKGIGRKVVEWLCNYGFTRLGLFRIFLYTFVDNTVARHLYDQLGFIHEGTLRSHVFHHGKAKDRCVFGLLRTDWERQPWRTEVSLQFELGES